MAARGPYAKTSAVQERAIAAALQILSSHGYSKTTLQEIAAEVGLTRAGLLHHFGSRDGLLVEVLRRRDEVNASFSARSSVNRLDATIATARRNAKVAGLVALYTSMAGLAAAEPKESENRKFFADRFSFLRSQISASIKAEQVAGHMKTEYDADELASIFIAASDGLQIQWLLDPSIDIPHRLELLVGLFARTPEPRS